MKESPKPKVYVICGGGGWLSQTKRLIDLLQPDSDLFYAVVEDGWDESLPFESERVRIVPRTVAPSSFKMMKMSIVCAL